METNLSLSFYKAHLQLLLRDTIELVPGIRKISRKPIILDAHRLSGAFIANYRLTKRFYNHEAALFGILFFKKAKKVPFDETFRAVEQSSPRLHADIKITPCEKGHVHPLSARNFISTLS